MIPSRPIALVLAGAALLAACSDSSGPELPRVGSIVVSGLPDTLGVGDTVRAQAEARDAGGATLSRVALRWRSLTPAVATIDSTGVLAARDSGEATLVVLARGRTVVEDTLTVPVRRLPREFAFGTLPDSILVGDSTTVAVTLRDGTGTDVTAPVTWSSSDTTVARVDENGEVKTRNLGTAWIRASSRGATDSVRVRGEFRQVWPEREWVGMSHGSQRGLCALAANGEAWCDTQRTSTVGVAAKVAGGVPLRTIEVGQDTACGLAADSTMYCWGSNTNTEFGLGKRQPFSSDTLVHGGGGRKWSRITMGHHRAVCGIQAADGVVYCWGHNDFVQTGRGPARPYDSLVAPHPTPLAAKDVALGAFHGCAIALDDAMWCWGQARGWAGGAGEREPVQVRPAGSFTHVTVGDYLTCGLSASGEASCWGADGPTAPTRVETSARFARIATGLSHDVCGLTAGGELHCWVVYGDGPIVARHVMPGRTFTAYSTGAGTRRCALSTTGRIYCW